MAKAHENSNFAKILVHTFCKYDLIACFPFDVTLCYWVGTHEIDLVSISYVKVGFRHYSQMLSEIQI